MKLRELKKIIDFTLKHQQAHYNPDVTIIVEGNSIGARPSERVKGANAGFDWNSWNTKC